MTISAPIPSSAATARAQSVPETRARAAAEQLEASFLSEMLKAAGFGQQISSFSGGSGENQFASFHRDAIARQMAESGGVGLAEHFFRSIMEKNNGT